MIDANANKINYATFNRRTIASSIDTMILIIVLYVLMLPFNYFLYGASDLAALLTSHPELESDPEAMKKLLLEHNIPLKIMANQVISLVITFALLLYCWYKFDETPGKWLTECRILDEKTMLRPSKRQYMIRALSYMISALPLCLGFFAVYWDKKNRGWHDRLAGTVVVVEPHPWKSFSEIWLEIKSFVRKLTK